MKRQKLHYLYKYNIKLYYKQNISPTYFTHIKNYSN